jgi:hypothetical protein
MKNARERFKATGGESARVIRIEVKGANEAGWQVPLKQISGVPMNRRIPGSLVTNILCASGPERRVELRLMRFVQAPQERLGFFVA